jgi:hypothetical protein
MMVSSNLQLGRKIVVDRATSAQIEAYLSIVLSLNELFHAKPKDGQSNGQT